MDYQAPSSRELTRRLVGRATTPNQAPDHIALAAHAACERIYRELTRTLGLSGSEALLLRAIAQAQIKHPLLAQIRIGRLAKPDLEGATEMIRTHGAPAVAAGLEAVLEALLDLLGRLIGEDMVARLVEQSSPNGVHGDREAK